MANIMSNFKARNNVSRNGFDLTFRNTYSAKVGELLPIMCEECLPGDKFKINLQGFSRTEPLTSPAFIRLKEYYDFVFVPYRLLWKYYDDFVTQMPNNQASSTFYSGTANFTRHPWFSWKKAKAYTTLLGAQSEKDDVGYDREFTSLKLLDYLDYDPYNWSTNLTSDVALNPFPLLAYQKAYADIYRFDQWENPEPHSYNLDYLNTNAVELNFPTSSANIPDHDIFSMRYANYAKDMFMGLLPNSQYGDVSVVSTAYDVKRLLLPSNVSSGQAIQAQNNADNSYVTLGSNSEVNSVFNMSILALRQAEFLQKYKEVTQTAKQDYKAQIKAHWGVDVSSARSNLCEYVGGVDGVVQIDQVVNQSLTSGVSAGSFMNGIASGFGRGQIDYDVKEHGLMLCIYHSAPILQYKGGVAPVNFKSAPTDYAIPEMDRTGMQSVPSIWFTGFERSTGSTVNEGIAGYAPRYIEYKTKVDKIHGNFYQANENWVAPMSASYLFTKLLSQTVSHYQILKVNPSFLDDVFATVADETDTTDQLKCNVDFDVKVVRNLDYDGMPY